MMLAVGARRLAEIEREPAGGDGRAARVGIAAAEDQGSAAGLGQAARAAKPAAVDRAGPVAAGAEREGMTAVGKADVAAAGQPAHVERRDRAAVGIEEQAVVGADGHGAVLQGIGIVQRDRAGRDRRAAAETVAARERQNARSCLIQGADAADRAAERRVVRAVEDQRRVVRDIAGQAARRAAAADLQDAGIDQRAAAIAVRPAEHEGAEARLGQGAAAADLRR